MADDRAIEGIVLDEAERPLAGVRVLALDVDVPETLSGVLGSGATDADGAYRIPYRARRVADLFARRPDVQVRVLDAAGLREVARSDVFPDRDESTFRAPVIRVPRRAAEGWAVTLGGSRALRLTRGNAVEVLVDDEQFTACVDAVRRARRSAHLAQLLFESGFVADYSDGPPERAEPRARLLHTLLHANRRGVEVRILLNENAAVPDHVDEVRSFFDEAGDNLVMVRGFPMSPNVMHAKFLIVDDEEAILIGPPFEQKFWDTPAHPPHDPRRKRDRATHDVSLLVRGPAVADVADSFRRLWNLRADVAFGGVDVLGPPHRPPPAGNQAVQIVRTLQSGLLPSHPLGERGVLEAYLRAFAKAERLIYLENQYYTSPTVSAAIGRVLRAKPELEVVLVLNEDTDVPTYRAWQERRFRELGYPEETPRLGVFTLWSPSAGRDGRLENLHRLYVHSKVAVVDDKWATVGSANLDSVGFETGYEFAYPIPPSVEVNALLFDGVDGYPATGVAGAVRRRLWSEHLGIPEDELDARVRAEGGALALWREVAEENLARLQSGSPRIVGHAIPYQPGVPLPAPPVPRQPKP